MKKKRMGIWALLISACFIMAGCNGCGGEKTQPPATAVVLSVTEQSVKVFEFFTLTATVTEDGVEVEKSVVYSSDNVGVLTVDSSGKTFAKAAGTATVTATVEGTSATASCKFTVTYGASPVLTIDNVEENALSLGQDATFALELGVSFNGKDATDDDTTFGFTVADPTVVAVDASGVITALKTGTTDVTIYAAWRGLGGESMTGGENAFGLKQTIRVEVKNK